ncbi:hypothetical protein ACPV3S_19420 [Photobacterium damselae]|uniref:hypothetical protein n=1 Tax=Photobacterium damselae TaxID=38293 RepID=UPI0040682415
MKLIGVESIFREYKRNIKVQLNDRPELSICICIFNYLMSFESFKLKYVTYGSLMQITGCESEQFPNLVKATDYLTTRNAHLLDMYFEFCDDEMEDPEPIDNSAVHQALKDGVFFHPHSGKTISNFNHYIYPVFRPSEGLLEFRNKLILEHK